MAISKNKIQNIITKLNNFKAQLRNYNFLLSFNLKAISRTWTSFSSNNLNSNFKSLAVALFAISFCLLQSYTISHSIAHNFDKKSDSYNNHLEIKNSLNSKFSDDNSNDCKLCLFANFCKKIINFNNIIFGFILAKIIFDLQKILNIKIRSVFKCNCRAPPLAV